MLEGMMVYIWSALIVPHPVKFTAFIDESVEKNKSFSRKHGAYKILLELARKRLNKNIFFFVNCPF